MSYILDAVRKSEQQRSLGVAPSRFPARISSDTEKPPAFLHDSLIAAILIATGVLIGWLHPWQQDEAAAPAMEKPFPITLQSPVRRETTATAQEPALPELVNLPLAIQQEIPVLSISAHAYANLPKNRLVRVNDRLLHEGEELMRGLRLERITQNGLVFSYKEYFFRRVVPVDSGNDTGNDDLDTIASIGP